MRQDQLWLRRPSGCGGNGGQLGAVDRLAFEQQLYDPVKRAAIIAEQLRRPDLGLAQQPRYLLVDGALRLLGIGTARERVIAARPLGP